MLSSADPAEAVAYFEDAISSNTALFTARSNLALVRSARRDYSLPVVPFAQIERARLRHTVALGATKQGDVAMGRGLLQDSLDTHPQHFEPAARTLAALSRDVTT